MRNPTCDYDGSDGCKICAHINSHKPSKARS